MRKPNFEIKLKKKNQQQDETIDFINTMPLAFIFIFSVDACESKIEIVTPYWASNSAGKIRAIVNTQHFEQAIHQEVCT